MGAPKTLIQLEGFDDMKFKVDIPDKFLEAIDGLVAKKLYSNRDDFLMTCIRSHLFNIFPTTFSSLSGEPADTDGEEDGEVVLPKRFGLVSVIWLDHASAGEVRLSEISRLQLATCVSVGYKIFEDEQKIVLAATLDATTLYGSGVSDIIIIGKAMVKEVKPIELDEAEEVKK